MQDIKESLQELVECPICYEIFHEPKAFPCLHTLCSACISRTRSWHDVIKCPLCGTKSRTSDLKKDFRTQELVTLFCTFEDFGWNPVLEYEGTERAAPVISDSTRSSACSDIKLTFLFDVAAPDQTKIRQVLKRDSLYWFVLENGKVMTYSPADRRVKVMDVAEKQTLGRGLVGGIVAGLVAAPLGPTVAVAAAAGAFVVGSSFFRSRVKDADNKAQALACTRSGALVALCESKIPSGVVQRLIEVSAECAIQGQIGDVHCREHIKQVYAIGDVIQTVSTYPGSSKAWERETGGKEWRCEHVAPFRHQYEVALRRDESNYFCMDAESVYKYNRKRELVSAHNIPAAAKGKLSFCGACKGQLLLMDTNRRSMYVLHTVLNSWKTLSVPDPDWKPCYACLDTNQTVHVLCERGRTPGYRLYTIVL